MPTLLEAFRKQCRGAVITSWALSQQLLQGEYNHEKRERFPGASRSSGPDSSVASYAIAKRLHSSPV